MRTEVNERRGVEDGILVVEVLMKMVQVTSWERGFGDALLIE